MKNSTSIYHFALSWKFVVKKIIKPKKTKSAPLARLKVFTEEVTFVVSENLFWKKSSIKKGRRDISLQQLLALRF